MLKFNANLHLRAWVGTPARRHLVLDQPAHSILGNLLPLLFAQMAQSGIYGQPKDITGALYTVSNNSAMFDSTAIIGNAAKHIVVGTDYTAVTLADYKLGIKIEDGVTVGRLQYQAGSFNIIGKAVSAWSAVLARSFVNNSPASISVLESGVYLYGYKAGSTIEITCVIRDVFIALPVPVGKTLSMEYTIEIPLL